MIRCRQRENAELRQVEWKHLLYIIKIRSNQKEKKMKTPQHTDKKVKEEFEKSVCE